MSTDLRGVMPPVPTPFGEDGEVAYGRLAENLQRWNQTDLSGYLVVGSTGECATLTEQEKLRLWEVARKHIPGEKRFIAGTGCESTRETIALTNRAAMIGAEAALVVTPWYYKGAMKSRELEAHYTAVADATPIPILLYNVPQFTGVVIEPDAVAKLAGHPNIIGMKDSSGAMGTFAEFVRVTSSSFQLFVGTAMTFYAGLCLGARGGILALANVAPQECALVHRLFEDGKHDEAKRLQLRLILLTRAINSRFGIAGVKAAMAFRGYYGGPPRPPLLSLQPEEMEVVRRELAAAGLL
ncbi:MAG: dihydrodipicolinate synthase family protein [Candidatus Methylomirabilis oxyfera]|nr:dihydrodipicolinate synthase family protein [Candidatus Methylomirabilis oxyfera]